MSGPCTLLRHAMHLPGAENSTIQGSATQHYFQFTHKDLVKKQNGIDDGKTQDEKPANRI
jgi:hypothetical protein